MSLMSDPQHIQIGDVLQDTYVVRGEIGSGGVGVVFEAAHRRLSRPFAIKVLRPKVAREAEVVARFQREAELTSRLGHPHIVEIVDFNQTPDGLPYIVMERLQGEDLLTRLEDIGPLEPTRTARILDQACSALQAAHDQGIIHRDLKPQNVFLCRVGEDTDYVKILDFGMSKIHGLPSALTGPDMILGTPLYMSPEQAQGSSAAVDHRTDVFAMGAILYEMLSGRKAFLGQTLNEVLQNVIQREPPPLQQLCPELPLAAERVIAQALAKRREDRFGSVLELSRAFGRSLEASEVQGERTLPPDHAAIDPLGPTMVTPPSGLDGPAAGLDDMKTVPFEGNLSPGPSPSTQRLRREGGPVPARVLQVTLAGGLVGALAVVAYLGLKEEAPAPTPPPADLSLASSVTRAGAGSSTARADLSPAPEDLGPDAAPTRAARRTLTVTSEPPGALVLADGTRLGKTPVKDRPISTDAVHLVVRKPGFLPVRRRLGPGRGTTELELSLQPVPSRVGPEVQSVAPVRLRVAASFGGEPIRNATVLIDGVQRGTTPMQLDVPPGDYRLEVKAEGFKRATKQVQVQPGKRTTTVIVDLSR